MNNDSLLEEIEELNLAYLMLAKRLLCMDRATAIFRLKLTGEEAKFIEELSGEHAIKLSRCNQLIFRPIPGNLKAISDSFSNRSKRVSSLHAAIVIAAGCRTNEKIESTSQD